jgi:predicted nucleic acid-binding protein
MAMTVAEQAFLDTNILIRATIDTAPLHETARSTLQSYHAKGIELWISRQILREYLAVLSRPQSFSAPLAPHVLRDDVERFQQQFHVADEDARVTRQLVLLLQQIPVGGRQVHDANIVATMLVYGIPRLITHNVDDFVRFAGLITVVPLAAPPQATSTGTGPENGRLI